MNNYSQMSYREIQAQAKQRGINAGGKKEVIIERLREEDAKVPDLPTEDMASDVTSSMHQPVEIPPIEEHPRYEENTPIEYLELMRRIETLENRFNELIVAISTSRKVKGI